MRIFHVGASASPLKVDGVNRSVWTIACEQALLGHQIALVLGSPPLDQAVALARTAGLKLLYIPASQWHYSQKVLQDALRTYRPDLVHLHSVFIPPQASLAGELTRLGIPYVITAHGGLSPEVVGRGGLRKGLYGWLMEKPRFLGARAIGVVTPGEEKDVRAYVPRYQGLVHWLPNPVSADALKGYCWQGDTRSRRLVFLGRFDVVHKGLDLLAAIAHRLPEAEFHLYGTEDVRTRAQLEQIRRNRPQNFFFHPPVFGEQKARVLAEASLYIQTSRWEGFPVSIAEAMYLGVPCAFPATLNLAQLFEQHSLGLLLPAGVDRAAECLRDALARPEALRVYSERARAFAQSHFTPRFAAMEHLDLYHRVLAQSPSPTPPGPPKGRLLRTIHSPEVER